MSRSCVCPDRSVSDWVIKHCSDHSHYLGHFSNAEEIENISGCSACQEYKAQAEIGGARKKTCRKINCPENGDASNCKTNPLDGLVRMTNSVSKWREKGVCWHV